MTCITLLSDFGLQDASVAVAKGLLMQQVPGINIIDVSHEITPFNTRQAAYLLALAYKKFPPSTCHISVFDLFSEPTPRLVLSLHNGHYFFAPDNNLIPMALGTLPENAWLCFELKKENTSGDWLSAAGKTIQLLQSQTPKELGLAEYQLRQVNKAVAPLNKDVMACEVLHIDHYENVVLNITRQQFDALSQGRRFRLQIMQVEEITEISKNYNDVREGNKLCRFNSNNYLEICVNRGNAASLFGFRLNSKHNDIKIFFE